jgi:hypothetical protein
MINARVVRRGLLAGIACAALAAPGAQATHHGTCTGFEDLRCNIQYVEEHSVDPIEHAVNDALYPIRTELGRLINRVADTANDALYTVDRRLYAVLCGTFGAC